MTVRTSGAGLGLAAVSAATFGTAGSFASVLLASGWSPGAAVAVRIGIAAIVLTLPAMLALRGRWRLLRRDAVSVIAYGVAAVGIAQLCYFNAVEHLSVSVALLLEYSGTLLVVLWMWARHGQRPRRLTVIGGVVAVVGLAFVLDLTGGQRIDVVGVLWGLGAAVGLAAYFILSARVASDGGESLPGIAMAWAGMAMAALSLLAAGAVGVLPMHASMHDVAFRSVTTSWLVPVLGLSLVAAAFAYTTGIWAARMLGARLASFVGLGEVLAATLFAWLLLGQQPGVMQAVGGLLVLAGIALVRADERDPEPPTPELPVPELLAPDLRSDDADAPAAGPAAPGERRRGPARAMAGRLHRSARTHHGSRRARAGDADRPGRSPRVDRRPIRTARR